MRVKTYKQRSGKVSNFTDEKHFIKRLITHFVRGQKRKKRGNSEEKKRREKPFFFQTKKKGEKTFK